MTNQKWVKPLHYDDVWYDEFDLDVNKAQINDFEISIYRQVKLSDDIFTPIAAMRSESKSFSDYHWLGHP